MAKAKKDAVWKSILVLAAIALCSGLLLGFFNVITYVDPLQSAYDRFAEDTGASFSEMADEEGASYESGSVVYYALSDDGAWNAFLASGSGGFGGSVQVYLYFRGSVLEKILIGENGETYLDRLDDAFYGQFLGKDVSELSGLEADLVSGATKSSTAVANAIAAAVRYWNENVAGGETNESA